MFTMFTIRGIVHWLTIFLILFTICKTFVNISVESEEYLIFLDTIICIYFVSTNKSSIIY